MNIMLTGFLSDLSTFDKVIVIGIVGAIIYGAVKSKKGGGGGRGRSNSGNNSGGDAA